MAAVVMETSDRVGNASSCPDHARQRRDAGTATATGKPPIWPPVWMARSALSANGPGVMITTPAEARTYPTWS